MNGETDSGETVVRRSGQGWVVGGEEASDLTSAMVLADLLAADLATLGGPGSGPAESGSAAGTERATEPGRAAPRAAARHARPLAEADEAARLAVTVSQLQHALTARIRVEQAVGVLAERHRLRTREAFDLLRTAARTRGRRVVDVAEEVVSTTASSLLRLPEELARKPESRAQIRSARRSRPVS
ncbi:MAG: ANTAR domain-containing protein [Streptosporangiaceae bacterium]